MTGAYLRIKRDGEWQRIEIEYLTPDERREALKDRTPDDLLQWIKMLCEAIQERTEERKQLRAALLVAKGDAHSPGVFETIDEALWGKKDDAEKPAPPC